MAAPTEAKKKEMNEPTDAQKKELKIPDTNPLGLKIDENNLPRLPDGRRWVEVIHAPALLEHASHLMPLFGLFTFFYLSDNFTNFAKWNIILHLIIFGTTVHIPALITGKFSWIDLSWPLGLASMGLQVWFMGTAPTMHRGITAIQYFLIGSRMAMWILVNWRIVVYGRELPRYQYRRLVWEEKPFCCGLITNTKLSMQMEICEQWVWNVSWLCVPAMLHAYDTSTSWSVLEIIGHVIWAISFCCETLGDKQKFAWTQKKKAEGVEARLGRTGGDVCNVGIWRYTRHPNYFFQWLGWVGICISSIPALGRLTTPSLGCTPVLMAYAALLLYVPVGSYLMMVYYTGSWPAEVYSVQTRPAYKQYQKTTSIFFPMPPKADAREGYIAIE